MKFVSEEEKPQLFIGGGICEGCENVYAPFPRDLQLLQLYKVIKWAEGIKDEIPTKVEQKETLELLNLAWGLRRGLYLRSERFSGMLRALDALFLLPDEIIEKTLSFGAEYDFGQGIGHASKVTQMALLLWLGLKDRLSLSSRTLKPLVIASILHDIGRKIEASRHHAIGSSIVKEVEWLSNWESWVTSKLVYHHRNFTNLEKEGYLIKALGGIIRVADGLDYSLDQTVWDVRVINRECVTLEIVCRGLCHNSYERAIKKSKTLRDLLGCLNFNLQFL